MEFVEVVFVVETTGLFTRSKYKCEVSEVGRDKITKLEHSPIVPCASGHGEMFGKPPDDKKSHSLEACRERVEVPWSDGLNAASIVVPKMNRFQLVGGRPFVVAQEPVLEESFEG